MEIIAPFPTEDISHFQLSAHARERWLERYLPKLKKTAQNDMRKDDDLMSFLKKARFLRKSRRKGTSYLCAGHVVFVKNQTIITIYKPDRFQQAWAYA